jgi:hypothetical protein
MDHGRPAPANTISAARAQLKGKIVAAQSFHFKVTRFCRRITG